MYSDVKSTCRLCRYTRIDEILKNAAGETDTVISHMPVREKIETKLPNTSNVSESLFIIILLSLLNFD